jgi:hypothetical protein
MGMQRRYPAPILNHPHGRQYRTGATLGTRPCQDSRHSWPPARGCARPRPPLSPTTLSYAGMESFPMHLETAGHAHAMCVRHTMPADTGAASNRAAATAEPAGAANP